MNCVYNNHKHHVHILKQNIISELKTATKWLPYITKNIVLETYSIFIYI